MRGRPIAEPGDGLQQTVAHVDLRFPLQFGARERDVGLALRRIILGAFDELDRRVGSGELADELRQLQDGHLVRIADVHRTGEVGEQQPQRALDQVVDVAHRSRLTAVALNRDRGAGQRLADEVRDRPAVVRAHPRAVGVEDPHDRGVDPVLRAVRGGQCLGEALRLVVAGAGPDRIDIAPVGLGLGVDERVAVRLRGGCQQEAGTLLLRQAQAVQRPQRTRLHRLDRKLGIVDR